MIHIQDKHNCCGCAACVQACPKQCISFDEDKQGFRYPLVDESLCIECGLCEKVCPVINQADVKKPLKVYAAQNPSEEIRLQSSSGGIFTMLAEAVIDDGGVVFGAQFDKNWEVEHSYSETKVGLAAFRGSKYLQSRTGDTYKQARDFLKAGRKVLYSGTSCQIAGLKKFLRKEYENLITVDVVCHGAPSPLVWRTYLDDLIKCPKGTAGKNSVCLSLNEMPVITGISFRDKSTGWKKYGFVLSGKSASKADKNTVLSSVNPEEKHDVLLHETVDKNLYMDVFTKDLCLRPSCHSCPAKIGKSGSDITLADYWGIQNHYPEMDDDKGTSLVLVNTEKGNALYQSVPSKKIETPYEIAFAGNPALERSAKETEYAAEFWQCFLESKFKNVRLILKHFRLPLNYRLKLFMISIIKSVVPIKILKQIKSILK